MTACASVVGAALIHCLSAQPGCLPPDPPPLEALVAVARQESGFFPFAIRDEKEKRSLFPTTRDEAVREIAERRRKGHPLGVGLFQNTHHENHRRHGLLDAQGLPTLALDPCASLRAGAAHLKDDLMVAALQRYNSGRLDGAPAYAASVLSHMRRAEARPRPAAPVAQVQRPCVPGWAMWSTCRPTPAADQLSAGAPSPPSAEPVALRGQLAMGTNAR